MEQRKRILRVSAICFAMALGILTARYVRLGASRTDRMTSKGEPWAYVLENLPKVRVGMRRDEVVGVLGRPDTEYKVVPTGELHLHYQHRGGKHPDQSYEFIFAGGKLKTIQKLRFYMEGGERVADKEILSHAATPSAH